MEVNSSSVALLMSIGFDSVTDVSITITKLGFIYIKKKHLNQKS